jgi:hypothetical protein
MTWEKFARTMLPEALSIEAQVPAGPERFMALVTAANADAPPILQWDAEERRNPTELVLPRGHRRRDEAPGRGRGRTI